MAKTSDYHKSEVLGWFVSKFGAFLSNEMMRNIIGQTKSSINLRSVMDEGKILLVNLSKGRTGELNSKLLGMIFVMKFQATAMSRAAIPEEHRRDFSLYVDEFQNFSTDSFATILSEARKYRLNLIVANQFITQLSEEIRDAVFGNVGSLVGLRVGATDADFLTKQFSPTFDLEDLIKLPNFNAIVRLMIGGIPSQPFTMATMPQLGHPNKELSAALKRLSAAKYARPRQVVENEIFERLQTLPEPKQPPSQFDNPFASMSSNVPRRTPPTTPPVSSGPSFLDEWLAKRRQAATVQAKLPAVDTSLDDEVMVAPQPQPAFAPAQSSIKTPPKSKLPIQSSTTNEHARIEEDEEVIAPTDFARAKASGELPDIESNLEGNVKDKDATADIADLVKKQIDYSRIESREQTTNDADKKEDQTVKPVEIEVDDEGNIKLDVAK
jgi:hypothetical protein